MGKLKISKGVPYALQNSREWQHSQGLLCTACSGSGYYDVAGSPPCTECGGTGKNLRKADS